ncbi:MAG: hypothetical protein AAGA80_21810 [Cyanobacteria bacterium P01_F01_bin.143]
MSNPKKICFFPETNDSKNFFGSSVVANDKYLAVGNASINRSNKVIIYVSDNSGRWSRTREILPPEDLALDREGSIFGQELELDGNILTISARVRNPDVSKDNSSLSQAVNTFPRYSYRRYLINLRTDTDVQPIELLVQKEPESNLVRFNLLRQSKIEQFTLPDMGEKHLSVNESFYGSKIALDQNLLLVGYSSSLDNSGGAWLFDLAQPQTKPIKIAVEDAALGSTVAISQQFAAVGFNGVTWYYPSGHRKSPKTLIRNLNNGSTTVIDSFGELSLSENILAVMRPSSPDGEQRPLLEVFRIDENTTPHLILRRTNVSRAKVQNKFLILVKYLRDFNYSQICIEPLT